MSRALPRFHGLVLAAALISLVSCSGLGLRPEPEFSWDEGAAAVWPMRSTIANPFQPSSRPDHDGIDLAAGPGTPVVAIRPGEVRRSETRHGWGTVVVLAHGDGVTSVYANLRESRVVSGDRVERGEVVGRLDERGLLHFEIRRANRPVNPQEFYEIAPPPPVQERLPEPDVASEPHGSPLEVIPPPSPTVVPTIATPTPTPEPTPNPTPMEGAKPTPAPVEPTPEQPAPAATPTSAPSRSPTATMPPAATPTPERTPSPGPVREPATGGERSTGIRITPLDVGHGVIALFANAGYVPMKLAYAGVGAMSGAMAYVLTQNRQVASEIWWPSLGGDFWVGLDHVRGTRPLRFVGRWPEEAAETTPESDASP